MLYKTPNENLILYHIFLTHLQATLYTVVNLLPIFRCFYITVIFLMSAAQRPEDDELIMFTSTHPLEMMKYSILVLWFPVRETVQVICQGCSINSMQTQSIQTNV